jgi:hypothetical protein
MKVTKLFAIFSCVLVLSMLLSTAGVTARASANRSPTGMPDPVITFIGLVLHQAPVSAVTAGARYQRCWHDSLHRLSTNRCYVTKVALIAQATFDNFWNGAGTGTVCDGNFQPAHPGSPCLRPHGATLGDLDLADTDVDNGLIISVWLFLTTYGEHPQLSNSAGCTMHRPPPGWPDSYYIADLYDIYNNGTSRSAQGAKSGQSTGTTCQPYRTFKSFYMTEADYGYRTAPSTRKVILLHGTPNFFVAIAPPHSILAVHRRLTNMDLTFL